MQQNSKCRLCGDRDETINHIISDCNKLAQKEYKTRHDWIGKVIHWEMCKKFNFDHTNKWYMHNPAPLLENNTHKLLWDKRYHVPFLKSLVWRELVLNPGLTDHWLTLYPLGLWAGLHRTKLEHEVNGYTDWNWCSQNNPPWLSKKM